ncbi:putative F-box domain-containing protein [Medicago truncatula]|uniref:Putative F-box domain-containing protein n=1 Tax=Medicago truncatula TaxID=3880 RepID=A0A396JFV4_MEDTR|nr:putative F-box domain-containing protein [Medicago truncatula]
MSSSPAKKHKFESTKNPNWVELPKDITSNILQRLNTVEILTKTRYVCPYWWNICKDPFMWCEINMGTFLSYLMIMGLIILIVWLTFVSTLLI